MKISTDGLQPLLTTAITRKNAARVAMNFTATTNCGATMSNQLRRLQRASTSATQHVKDRRQQANHDVSGHVVDLLSPHYKLGYAQASLELIVQELSLLDEAKRARAINIATDALLVVRRTE
jgi:hypothetical protein